MKNLLIATTALALSATTALADAPLTSPRPKPKPVDLTLPVKLAPCAILMRDTLTGFGWYEDGTVAGSGVLPETRYASALDAWAWIETTIAPSPSATGMVFTPVCYKD